MKLSNKFKQFLFSDPTGKLGAILIAYFLWYYVQNFSLEKIYISLPVTIVNAPENKVIDATNDIAIRVEISAYEDVSRRIDNLSAIIDLSNYTPGIKTYPITLLNLPKDIKADISPESKRISIYDIITKTIPINVNIHSNDTLTNIVYNPKEVSISGSSQVIDQIKALTTEELRITNPIQNVISTNIKIIYPNKVELLDKDSIAVTLFFNLKNYTNEVIVPVKYIGLQSNLQMSFITNMYLKFVTKTSNIEPLLIESFMSLDFSTITNAGKYNIPVTISVPTNVLLIDPPTIVPIELIDPLEIASPIKESLMPETPEKDDFDSFFDESILKETSELPTENFNTNITTNTTDSTNTIDDSI